MTDTPTTTQVEQAALVQIGTTLILEALGRLFAHWGAQGEVYPGHVQDVQAAQQVVQLIATPPAVAKS